MKTTMLYRIDGKSEGEVGTVQVDGIDLQYKVFDDEAIDSARGRGWVRIGQIMEAKASVDGEKEPKPGDEGESGEGDKAPSEDAEHEEPATHPAYPTEDRDALVQWIRDNGYADKIDLRKSLPVLIEQLEQVLNG